MTLDDFVAKWLGKKCDFDGVNDGQCIDLARMYCREVLNTTLCPPLGLNGKAADIWTTYNTSSFTSILNSPTGVPSPGDLVIWDTSAGAGYGHVDIFLSGNASSFIGLDQNWPTPSLVTKTPHTYLRPKVIGWLHPKSVPDVVVDPKIVELQKEIEDKNKQISSYAEQVSGWEKKYNETVGQLNEANTSSEGFRKQHNDFVAKLAQILGTRQEAVEIIASVETAITYEDKATELDRTIELERKEHQVALDALGKELSAVKAQLVSLESKYKELKNTTVTPTQPKQSIISYIFSLFRR